MIPISHRVRKLIVEVIIYTKTDTIVSAHGHDRNRRDIELLETGELFIKSKSKLSLYSLYYAEVRNEFAGTPPRHCAQATQLLSKKCCSSGKPFATLCPI